MIVDMHTHYIPAAYLEALQRDDNPFGLRVGKLPSGRPALLGDNRAISLLDGFHDIDAKISPRQFCRVFFLDEQDLLAVDNKFSIAHGNIMIPPAVHGVMAQQICEIFKITKIIDRHNLDFRP